MPNDEEHVPSQEGEKVVVPEVVSVDHDVPATAEDVGLVLGAATNVVSGFDAQTDDFADGDIALARALEPIKKGVDEALGELRASVDGRGDVDGVSLEKRKAAAEVRDIFLKFQAGRVAEKDACEQLKILPLGESMDQGAQAVFGPQFCIDLYREKIRAGAFDELSVRPIDELVAYENASVFFFDNESKGLPWSKRELVARCIARKPIGEITGLLNAASFDFEYRRIQGCVQDRIREILDDDRMVGLKNKFPSMDRYLVDSISGRGFEKILSRQDIFEHIPFGEALKYVVDDEKREFLARRPIAEVMTLDLSDAQKIKVWQDKMTAGHYEELGERPLEELRYFLQKISAEEVVSFISNTTWSARKIIDILQGTTHENLLTRVLGKHNIDTSGVNISEIILYFPEGYSKTVALANKPIRLLVGSDLSRDVLLGVLIKKWYDSLGTQRYSRALDGRSGDVGFHMLSMDLLLDVYQSCTKDVRFLRDVLAVKSIDELLGSIPGGATNELFWDIIVWKPLEDVRAQWPGIRQGVPMKNLFFRRVLIEKFKRVINVYNRDNNVPGYEFVEEDLAIGCSVSELVRAARETKKDMYYLGEVLQKKSFIEIIEAYKTAGLSRDHVLSAAGNDPEKWAQALKQDVLTEKELLEKINYRGNDTFRFSHITRLSELGVLPRERVMEFAKFFKLKETCADSSFFAESERLDIARLRPLFETFDIKDSFTFDEMKKIIESLDDSAIVPPVTLEQVVPYLSHERLVEVAKLHSFAQTLTLSEGVFTRKEILAIANARPLSELPPHIFSTDEYRNICLERPLIDYTQIRRPISVGIQSFFARRIISEPTDRILQHFLTIEKEDMNGQEEDVIRAALRTWCRITACMPEPIPLQRFCLLYENEGEVAAHKYLATLKQRAVSLINNPTELRNDEEYKFYIRHIFPSGNYSTHEKNIACGDRLEHLDSYTFDPDGYPVEMSGLFGYRLKEVGDGGERQQPDDVLFSEFQGRLKKIRDTIVQRGPDNEALQKDFDALVDVMFREYADISFAHLHESLSPKEKLFALFVSEAIRRQQKKDKYTPNKGILDLAIMYKYAYYEDLEAYVRRTADEAQSFRDPDSQRYVMLQELSTVYGENMKHVLRHNVWEELVAQKDGHFAEIVEQYNESVGGQTEDRSLKPKQIERIQQGIENPNIPPDDQEVVDSKTGQTKIKSGKFSVLSKQVRDMFGTNIKFRANEEREAFDSELTEILAPLRTDVSMTAFEQLIPRLFALRERYRFNLASQLEDVFTADLHRINAEIAKYEEVVEEEKKETRMNGPKDKKVEKSSKKRKIRGFITKTKETANARMGAYLCIAGDTKMWENKNYFELVMKDEDTGKCVGLTMMLKIDAQDGKKYLWFGPNPFESFLTQVRADACLEYMYNTARQFAEENGFDGIVIPSNESAVLGSCTNRGGTFPDLINAKRLRDSKGQSRVVPFGGQHDLGGSYGFTDGGLIWERGVKQKKAAPIIA